MLTSLFPVTAKLRCRETETMKRIGENVVRIEAEALRALADRIAGPMAAAFQRAVDLMFSCAGRVVVRAWGRAD